MRARSLVSTLALLLGSAGCLPSSNGETSSFLGSLGAAFSTCYEVAACADSAWRLCEWDELERGACALLALAAMAPPPTP